MRSKGEADRRRRAVSWELTREALLLYQRSRETQDLAEEVANFVFTEPAEDTQVSIGTGSSDPSSSTQSFVIARNGGNGSGDSNLGGLIAPHDITIFVTNFIRTKIYSKCAKQSSVLNNDKLETQ